MSERGSVFKELIHNRVVQVAGGLGIVATLGVGCVSESPSEAERNAPKSVENTQTNHRGDFTLEHIYTPSGKRITLEFCVDLESQQYACAIPLPSVVSWCDGPDLVERSVFRDANRGGTSIDRTETHIACEDRKLSEQDFS